MLHSNMYVVLPATYPSTHKGTGSASRNTHGQAGAHIQAEHVDKFVNLEVGCYAAQHVGIDPTQLIAAFDVRDHVIVTNGLTPLTRRDSFYVQCFNTQQHSHLSAHRSLQRTSPMASAR